jgi:glycosyltransferase involved in cell wall biosynthesis
MSKRVAAITITYNRLDLTKRTWEAFNAKTSVDYHLFVDNGSTDGTVEWLEDKYRVLLGKNYGIAAAFYYGVQQLKDYDYILKLDNDVETVTEDIINKMVDFIEQNGPHAVSPPDLMIDPAFYPKVFKTATLNGYKVQYTSHTGGAFQLAPAKYVRMLCEQYACLKNGDWMIGPYYRSIGCSPAYLLDLGMNHIGLNQSTPTKDYIF